MKKINIFVLANERRLRRDKPLEEFQGHAPRGPRTNFDLGALVIPSSNTVVRGSGGIPSEKF
jgi:hypothetical protein